MGLIFDIQSARLYDTWCQSPYGTAMERLVEKSIIELLDPHPGERVLDIGCGSGNHLLYLGKLGLDISGIDASPYMVNRAGGRLGDRCSLKTGKAEDLPYDDNEFDLAVLANTLEFLDDPLQALREAGRVANRKVFIGVMNSLSWHCFLNKLQALFRNSLFNHVRFFNLWELKSQMQLALGQVPIAWRSSLIVPLFFNRFGMITGDKWFFENVPFGSFLGLAATIVYRMKADKLPLKIRMKEAGESIVSGMTMGHLEKENRGYSPQRHGGHRGLKINNQYPMSKYYLKKYLDIEH